MCRRVVMFAVLALCAAGLTGAAVAADAPHHSLVQVLLDAPGAGEFLRANAGRFDIVFNKRGVEAHIVAGPDDIARLRKAGLPLTVLQEDIEAAGRYPDKGAGFGIFHTYSESVAFVDSLRLLYPQVVSEKWSIGTTHEARDIWCFRVSANPDVDEAEPEILIDAMHHAREIMAGEFAIMFAEYLAQNHGSDPEVTWLLDNRELYIVPMVNPDGIVYNELIEPDGGGMWRKNRRLIDVETDLWGVDVNRNYPYEWGYDDIGSSPDPESPVYRGPSAGSEPETQALMNFINGRDFKTHDTIHTYGNLLLYPWGYVSTPTSDAAAFAQMADDMVRYNGYTPGQPIDAINYTVNGGTIDWSYGDASVFSFSTEIGTSSDYFWPPESRRGALFQENIAPHLYLMRVAGAFVAVGDPVISSVPVGASGRSIAPGDVGDLSFTVRNQSPCAGSAAVDLTVRTDDPWIQLLGARRTVGAMPPLGSSTLASDPIPVTVDPACTSGHVVDLTVTVHMPEGDFDFPVSFAVDTPVTMFVDDMESGLGNWTTTGTWGTTSSEAYSPILSLTDSPAGDYPDQTLSTATVNGTWKASALRFWHRYDIEAGYDYGRVQVSVDGGPWASVASFDGSQNTWREEVVVLSDYVGRDLALRFAMDSDYSLTFDGWYIDDVVLEGDPSASYDMAVPTPIEPVGGPITDATPALTVANATGSGGDATDYGFRVYGDALCTDLVATADGVVGGETVTAWTPSSLADGTYWWRACAGDGTNRSDLSSPETFTVYDASPVWSSAALGLRVLGNVTGSGSRIELSLPASASVSLDIFDARGALVRRLHDGTLDGGTRILEWDGRDRDGRHTASGVYFVRARIGSTDLTGRIVMVR